MRFKRRININAISYLKRKDIVGMMMRWIASLLVIHLLDRVAFVLSESAHKSKRHLVQWWITHGLVNLMNAVMCAPYVLLMMTDPASAFDPNRIRNSIAVHYESFPEVLSVMVHIYHALCYRMTASDIFHHVVFVPLLGAPALLYDWGGLQNYILFFLCGLPGAVMYFCLAAENCSIPLRVRESQTTMIMYTIIRTSGILYYVGAACVLLRQNRLTNLLRVVPFKVFMLQLITPVMNASYYGYEMYRRYERKKVRSKVHSRQHTLDALGTPL